MLQSAQNAIFLAQIAEIVSPHREGSNDHTSTSRPHVPRPRACPRQRRYCASHVVDLRDLAVAEQEHSHRQTSEPTIKLQHGATAAPRLPDATVGRYLMQLQIRVSASPR